MTPMHLALRLAIAIPLCLALLTTAALHARASLRVTPSGEGRHHHGLTAVARFTQALVLAAAIPLTGTSLKVMLIVFGFSFPIWMVVELRLLARRRRLSQLHVDERSA